MTAREKIKQKLEDNEIDYDEIIAIDEEAFVDSLVGVTTDMRAVYDYERMAEEFSEHYGCSITDALEHIEFNILRSLPYFGSKAPVIISFLR